MMSHRSFDRAWFLEPAMPPCGLRRGRSTSSEDEFHAELTLRARLEQVVLPVARIVGVQSIGRRLDQRVVVVTLRQVRAGEVDRRRRARGARSAVAKIEDVRGGSLVEHVLYVQLKAN